jgi:aminoglycoside phosphotransferase (APT) family kinase protein
MAPSADGIAILDAGRRRWWRVRSSRDRALTALAAVPEHGSDDDLVPVGDGLDHDVYRAGDLVLRVGDPASVAREALLLLKLATELPCPVPVPELVDEVEGVLGHRWLPGEPLLGRPAPAGLAVTLGRVLRRLHDLDVAAFENLGLPVEGDDLSIFAAGLTGPEPLVTTVRGRPPEPGRHRVLVHNDLGAEHLLVTGGRLSGIVDWSDAAVSDPAVDFGRLLRDFGPGFLDDAVTAYGGPPDTGFADRVLFLARCAALEDLAYGVSTGRADYSAAARASIGRLFPDT